MAKKKALFLTFQTEQDLVDWLKENISLDIDTTSHGDYYGTWEDVQATVRYKNNVIAKGEETVQQTHRSSW